jgi:phosphate transport system substrate-binding protein
MFDNLAKQSLLGNSTRVKHCVRQSMPTCLQKLLQVLRHTAFRRAVCQFLVVAGLGCFHLQAQSTVVVGSGSSVPAPLYKRWALEYGKRSPTVQLYYLPSGTSEGIKQISRGVGDFGAGEARLTDSERKAGHLVELPVVLIGIVPIYNVPEMHQQLRLSGEVLAEIFLGEIKTWNAAAIANLNPEVSLPEMKIQVINRPGGKGSNYVFTDFLSKASPHFRDRIGTTASPAWPVGIPAERSTDMVAKVASEPGAIGFVELEHAIKAGVSTVAVLNPSGKFIRASSESIEAACAAVESPDWNSFGASLTNAPGADSYPISSFSWIYLRPNSADSPRIRELQDLLRWIYSDGQHYAIEEGYAALPPPLLTALRKKVQEFTPDGKH